MLPTVLHFSNIHTEFCCSRLSQYFYPRQIYEAQLFNKHFTTNVQYFPQCNSLKKKKKIPSLLLSLNHVLKAQLRI